MQLLQKNIYLYFFMILFSMILGRFILESFTIVGMLVAIYLLIRHWHFYFDAMKENRYLYVALAFLIPIAIATIDSLDQSKSLSVLGRVVRYFFIGFIAVAMVQYKENGERLSLITFIAVLFIAIDAIIQWQTDYHILGYDPVRGNRVFGVFIGKAHLSYFLGTFAPIVFFFLYQKIEAKMTWLRIFLAVIAILILIIAIFIGGARAGMISLFVSALLFVIYLLYNGKIKHKLRFFGVIAILLVASATILSQSEIVQKRFKSTTSAYGTEKFFDRLTSNRTNLWKVGFEEVPNYWINGVGPRAFDKIYQNNPQKLKSFKYVWQPHLHGLEVLIETGVIGFIPYLLVLLYLFIRMFTARAGNMWIMMGFVAMMPINSHVGLYEGFWMSLVFPPIMIGLALAYQADKNYIKVQKASSPI
ncbi:O-antigen ligase family protein [Ignatzschineria indica]|uniref:O-antigen ligase family protein n=1 Tax=Ignatzschineria indica TaxID=472583 RepID=UPI0025763DC2|nr:O-antigen ligase family protein [Ignatzschineria indica]MDM1545275.1 O-antigen ligase family protein [Ignatzschineria indica]